MEKEINLSRVIQEFSVSDTAALSNQIINLKDNPAVSSPTFESDILSFIKNLRKYGIENLTRDPSMVSRAAEESTALKLEKLSGALNVLREMMDHPELLALLDHQIVENRLNQRLNEIQYAIGNLKDSGFFQLYSANGDDMPLDGKKILVVEDMPHNRLLLKKILKKQRSETVEAINGQEAVDLWREENDIDLIIMDMNMPVMDGFEATRSIREIEQSDGLDRIPIVALTALAMRGDKEKCLEAGCDDYLPKPVEANALISVSKKLLSGISTEGEEAVDSRFKLDLKPILIKSENHVVHCPLVAMLKKLSIQCIIENDVQAIELALYNNESDLLILEIPTDLELAFYLNSKFNNKYVIPVISQEEQSRLIARDRTASLRYPLSLDQIKKVLVTYSNKIKQAKKEKEQIADADSLAKIKGQASITEAVQKSNKQLAVWQKAFRKIGGDLVISYQFNLHGKYGFILGDVAGHDIQSGYSASWFSGLVKGVWGQNSDPFDLLRYLNNFFAHEAEEEDKRFVCALALLWDPLRNKLSYANAGIPGGILVKKNSKEAIDLKWKGIPIGMFPNMDMFDHDSIALYPGDRLYIATDGVLEALPSEVISGIGETKSNQPPQEALNSIVDFVSRSIEVTDDLTIAVFEARELPEPENGYRQSIKSTFQEVDAFIEQLDQFLQKKASNQFDWSMVSIAIREALINAVEHGNGRKAELPIDVDVELDSSSLTLKISDCGSGFDLSSEKERLEKEGDLRIHGRGIEMMENITREMKYTGSGVLLRFDKINSETSKVDH